VNDVVTAGMSERLAAAQPLHITTCAPAAQAAKAACVHGVAMARQNQTSPPSVNLQSAARRHVLRDMPILHDDEASCHHHGTSVVTWIRYWHTLARILALRGTTVWDEPAEFCPPLQSALQFTWLEAKRSLPYTVSNTNTSASTQINYN